MPAELFAAVNLIQIAFAHSRATAHPIIESDGPPEGWGWCYVDEEFVELPNTTKQVGKIKRWV